ncbi:MAG: nucleotidyltransferase family protein, partial [Acidimicrobiia bacterium]
STRLCQPKQLLPYGGRTLLDQSLNTARDAVFSQRMVTLGGAGGEVRETVDLDGFEVVDSVHYTDGCSSSIVAALAAVEQRSEGIVLLLGDQPGVAPATIASLVEAAADAPIAVCSYDDGIGHPFWFGRDVFVDLANLHGDKGVWKLIESGLHDVLQVPVPGPVPLDVDTWDDYQQLLAQEGS